MLSLVDVFEDGLSGDQLRHFGAAHCRSLKLRNTMRAENSSVDTQPPPHSPISV